jgi:hypothetical protein
MEQTMTSQTLSTFTASQPELKARLAEIDADSYEAHLLRCEISRRRGGCVMPLTFDEFTRYGDQGC